MCGAGVGVGGGGSGAMGSAGHKALSGPKNGWRGDERAGMHQMHAMPAGMGSMGSMHHNNQRIGMMQQGRSTMGGGIVGGIGGGMPPQMQGQMPGMMQQGPPFMNYPGQMMLPQHMGMHPGGMPPPRMPHGGGQKPIMVMAYIDQTTGLPIATHQIGGPMGPMHPHTRFPAQPGPMGMSGGMAPGPLILPTSTGMPGSSVGMMGLPGAPPNAPMSGVMGVCSGPMSSVNVGSAQHTMAPSHMYGAGGPNAPLVTCMSP